MESGDQRAEVLPRLIVGLGNPGRKYANTRHNIGFLVADACAASLGARFAPDKRRRGEVAGSASDGVWLLKPQTFMNLSGESVGAMARFLKVEPAEVLVVLDDLDLPWGTLRLRPKGSAGGHNGLKSIIAHLGTDAFPRLRIGVGRPEGRGGVVGHVLGKFDSREQSVLDVLISRAKDCVFAAVRSGLPAAMNVFNQKPQASGQETGEGGDRPKGHPPQTNPSIK